MAFLSDVYTALGLQAETILYPAGHPAPSTPSPVAGVQVLIMPGWPDAAAVNSVIAAGNARLSIWSDPNTRNTNRYPNEEDDGAALAATYTLTQAGQVVTVGGAAPTVYAQQNLVIFVNGLPYIVGSTAGQTPTQLAAALQALIVVAVPGTTVVGPAITLPALARIGALRIGTTGITTRSVVTVERMFRLITHAPNALVRDAITNPLWLGLADIPRLTFADGSMGRLIFRSDQMIDTEQKQGIYRRDLCFTVEFTGIATLTRTQITNITETVGDQYGDVQTLNQ